MKVTAGKLLRPGFCIYIDTLCQGAVPVESDGEGKIVVYATREEAEREIAEDTIERLNQFLEGTREFDDAVNPEEYVVEVSVHPDGSIGDEAGNFFPEGKSPCV